jgi:uncharacterized protein YbjT (DUF2867 family)
MMAHRSAGGYTVGSRHRIAGIAMRILFTTLIALLLGAAAVPALATKPTRPDQVAPAYSPASAELAERIRKTRILVIGATGNNGGDIVAALDAVGARPRLLVRDIERAKQRWSGDRDWVQGDLTKPETLGAALAGIDVVINAAATRALEGPNGVDEVDLGGMRNLIAAGRKARIKRIVLITGMTVGRPESDWPQGPFKRGFAAKREAEKLLVASGIDYVILRPTGILPRPPHRYGILVVAQDDYRASLEELRMRAPAVAPDPNGPPPEGTIGRADLAEVAIVSAVHRDARRRVFVVTGTQAPASNAWVRELRRMPRN